MKRQQLAGTLFDGSKIVLETLHYFVTAGSHCCEDGPLLGQGTGVYIDVSLYTDVGDSEHHHVAVDISSRNTLVLQAGAADTNGSRDLLEGQLHCFRTGMGQRRVQEQSIWSCLQSAGDPVWAVARAQA